MDSFDKEWQRWFPEEKEKGKEPAQPAGRGCATSSVFFILAGAFALFILINMSKGFYTEWLWFSSLGYGSVYATILRIKIVLFFIAAILFCLVFSGNLFLATRLTPEAGKYSLPWHIIRGPEQALRFGVIIGTIVLSLIFGAWAQANWQVVLNFFNGQPFGNTDPVFHKEIAFYVFSLPFMRLVRSWLLGVLIMTVFGSVGIYILGYTVKRFKFDFSRGVLAHIGGLVIVILGLVAFGYWLGIWELVFSPHGALFGAGYADMNARLPAQWILLVVVLVCAGILVFSVSRRNYRWPLYAIGGWIGVAIIIGGIFPAMIQRFQVQPNELAREGPYIEYNIQFTREAFNLNDVDERPFAAEESPSPEDIEQNQMTIDNIRLWDHRPLKDTYNQRQSLRLYYDFNDVDVDRYIIDSEYRQVMLSARELSAEKLAGEAQTWVNRQLQFTHGYGIVMSPVNEITAEGLPTMIIKDIPPVGDFDIKRPEIYFGEKTNNYVIVKTNTQEFDYPMGDENVYGHYKGSGGIQLNSLIRRAVYAWQFGDLNILISGELNPESRVLYYRNIKERVRHLAPFLKLDNDPYMVVMEGKLFWIQDAYTTTDRYPYSQPLGGGLNYIRNSVKAVIDAYNGSVTFYVADPEDALIQTYQKIFPELFVPIEQMPESLRVHLRYPEGLFNIQATVYQSYHMRDVRVFYNKEDLWTVPQEVYAGQEQPMEPYYVIMRLPDENDEEFLLMLPFTPVNKKNTIGWLAARCDGEYYGKLLAYFFPKDRLVYGPSQIENRIQQDTVITEQLALWGRGGSRVIRGNLLLIPLGESKLYVEPVFLQAESGGGIPELKRVIVVAGEKIAMEPTLRESLGVIFGTEEPSTVPAVEPPTPEGPAEPAVKPPTPVVPTEPVKPSGDDIASLIEQAQQHYDKAREYLKEGNWSGYGSELDALKAVLDRLAELTSE